MFSCEKCETFKNSFFHRTPLVAASVYRKASLWNYRKQFEPLINKRGEGVEFSLIFQREGDSDFSHKKGGVGKIGGLFF